MIVITGRNIEKNCEKTERDMNRDGHFSLNRDLGPCIPELYTITYSV
jgi:hypothetical protein